MVVYLGADHGGFALKSDLIAVLQRAAYEVVDLGTSSPDGDDDYPDFAALVAREVVRDPSARRGILICRSGAGMEIAANKIAGARAFLGLSPDQVHAARHDDDANMLVLAADYIAPDVAERMVTVFLETPFGNDERFVRRLDKVRALEA
jgi:ribose 5-phosphate isomerase B